MTYNVGRTRVHMSSGHAYNRPHAGGDVSEIATMQEAENVILSDINARLQNGAIENGDYSVFINGRELIYRIRWISAIDSYSVNYFPPIE